jgi:hypothetical protein
MVCPHYLLWWRNKKKLRLKNITRQENPPFYLLVCYAIFDKKGEIFQAESVREAAWRCDWVGMPLALQRCLVFITAMASKEFTLTAGKFVPVSRTTMLNVRIISRLQATHAVRSMCRTRLVTVPGVSNSDTFRNIKIASRYDIHNRNSSNYMTT